MKNTEKTFQWIVDILQKLDIPFVIAGGLAAKSYGSTRELNDIDIDIHDRDFDRLVSEVAPYITYGPSHYKDERWDALLMTLDHDGQLIDIDGGDSLKICDARTGEWKLETTDFEHVEQRMIFDRMVPVIAPEDLVAYKSMLVGEHQQVDIQAAKDFLKSSL